MNTMFFTDVEPFAERIRPFLLQHEASNNLMLSLLTSLARGPRRRRNLPFMAAISDDDGAVQLAAIFVPTRRMVLAVQPGRVAPAAVTLLVQALHENGRFLPAVIGPQSVTTAFAAAWQQVAGPYRRGAVQGVFQATHIRTMPPVAGRMRLAQADDLQTITDWIFGLDAAEATAPQLSVTQQLAAQLIQYGELFVWQDEAGTAVCMASKTRPTENGIGIDRLYTPPAQRRRGYATALLAHVSQHLLHDAPRFCTIMTELTNPVAAHICPAVGYTLVSQFAEFVWDVDG